MKSFVRTLLMCSAVPLIAASPVLAAEQTGSISYEDLNLDSDLIAVLPASTDMAVLPDAPAPAEDTVGAGMGASVRPGEGHWHGGGPGGHHHHGILGALEGPLAVTDDQYEKLYSLRNQYLDSIAPKTMEIGQLSRRMKDALVSANMDPAAVSDLGNKINGLKSEIASAKLKRLIASAQVLTSDQRKALHDKMIRHSVEGGGMEMHGHGGHHH